MSEFFFGVSVSVGGLVAFAFVVKFLISYFVFVLVVLTAGATSGCAVVTFSFFFSPLLFFFVATLRHAHV